jgi:hypothetical protein
VHSQPRAEPCNKLQATESAERQVRSISFFLHLGTGRSCYRVAGFSFWKQELSAGNTTGMVSLRLCSSVGSLQTYAKITGTVVPSAVLGHPFLSRAWVDFCRTRDPRGSCCCSSCGRSPGSVPRLRLHTDRS